MKKKYKHGLSTCAHYVIHKDIKASSFIDANRFFCFLISNRCGISKFTKSILKPNAKEHLLATATCLGEFNTMPLWLLTDMRNYLTTVLRQPPQNAAIAATKEASK